jgi:predicted Rossmann fold nucleotide-binding protein DprA/Smf involved in DNA uptake
VSDYYPERLDTLPLFRRTDPATSRAAAAESKAFSGEHHVAILDALRDGPAGATGIGSRCGLLPHQVNRRIHELAKSGRIEQTGRVVMSASGRGEREWRLPRSVAGNG